MYHNDLLYQSCPCLRLIVNSEIILIFRIKDPYIIAACSTNKPTPHSSSAEVEGEQDNRAVLVVIGLTRKAPSKCEIYN